MKSPGSWRELVPRAYRKPMGKLLEACREPLVESSWEVLIKGLGRPCRKPLGKLLGKLLEACRGPL